MKISEAFNVVTTRPLSALNVVGIAELVQFTEFDPKEMITKAASADSAIRKEWAWELEDSDLNFLAFKQLMLVFKDGSTIALKG